MSFASKNVQSRFLFIRITITTIYNFCTWVCFVEKSTVTGIFFWGGQSNFSRREMPFPGTKFPFWYTQNKFSRFEKWKAKNKNKNKKKKSPLPIFELSLLPFSIFHLPFYNFLLFFSISSLFHLPFFPVGQHKFPGHKSLRGTLPPSLPLACYATEWVIRNWQEMMTE